MCIGVSSTALQKEERAVFVIPKGYGFLLRKSTLLNVVTGKFYSNQEMYFQKIFRNKCLKLVYLQYLKLKSNIFP